jgi:molecular chaperone GrpE (heat shock protein)
VDHPSEETLKRFAAGNASREESRIVVAHLLKGCALCAKRLKSMMQPESVGPVSYDEALDRFDEKILEALETSISPRQTLRTILRGVFPQERPAPKRREDE